MCQIIGVPAADVLNYALQRTEIDLHTIDLHAVLSDKRPKLGPLRSWARKRLDADPSGPGIVQLERPVLDEIAKLFDIEQAELMR